jgi:tRNA 5-methylaminomethyl-2-thiouridine biosynthesis bifunctional protein
MYDIAIIGAGINGCSVAYEFIKEGKSVLLFDKEGIASGGSGAAGAFISPRFTKSGDTKKIINTAFSYAYNYYEKNFPDYFTKAQLLHIAKDTAEDEAIRFFKEESEFSLLDIDTEVLQSLSQEAKKREKVSLNAGVVDAQGVCLAMATGVRYIQEKVDTLVFEDDYWIINEDYSAKNVIMAMGAYEPLIKEPYIPIRGIWGHRIDIKTTTKNPYSIHQFVSISSSKENQLAIGATHNVHYHPEKNRGPYDIEAGREELLQKAAKTLTLENVEIVKDYTGLRSGSSDYMPLVGSLVLSNETLLTSTRRMLEQKKPDFTAFTYYPNLYMINGSGGYGFVLAPYLANILKEHILNAVPIDEKIIPARFFARWARRRR